MIAAAVPLENPFQQRRNKRPPRSQKGSATEGTFHRDGCGPPWKTPSCYAPAVSKGWLPAAAVRALRFAPRGFRHASPRNGGGTPLSAHWVCQRDLPRGVFRKRSGSLNPPIVSRPLPRLCGNIGRSSLPPGWMARPPDGSRLLRLQPPLPAKLPRRGESLHHSRGPSGAGPKTART